MAFFFVTHWTDLRCLLCQTPTYIIASYRARTIALHRAALGTSPSMSQSQANSHCWLTQTVHLSSVAVFASNHLTISSYVELTDETSRPWLCVAVQQQAPRTSALSKQQKVSTQEVWHAYGPARNSVSSMVTVVNIAFCTCPVPRTRSCRSTILGSQIVEMGPYTS